MSKKPKAGEWWRSDCTTGPVLVHGVTKTGVVLVEYANGGGGYITTKDFMHWYTHLPDCTGWDWVTQDRVPARPRIDQCRWSSWTASEWEDVREGVTRSHGDKSDGFVSATFEVRCLRKDLPPLPPTVSTQLDCLLPPKLPLAGEWWQANDLDSVVLVHGVTKTGVVLYEYDTGGWGYGTTKDFMTWYKHSPDCTGWE